MKIAIINGSPRSSGATAKILKCIKVLLEKKKDVEAEYFDLSKYSITLCKGCIQCYKTGSCIIADDGIESAAKRIKEADAVVLGSPTYGSAISSYLKAFMDRGHFIVEQSLAGKYGFSVATYEVAEGNKTLDQIKKFFMVSGASRKGDLLVKLSHGTDPFSDPGLQRRIEKRVEKFYQAVRNKTPKSLFEHIFMDLIVIGLI
ncbi:MAG TPA: flavodoxin family protein [Clostridia bacterium]|nr:flavodoxin family protein [Clostridia bacterium]